MCYICKQITPREFPVGAFLISIGKILTSYMDSYTIYRSKFESLRFDPAFRLKRSEGRNAGSETQQQDPVKNFRTSGSIWTGLDARSGAPMGSCAWSTEGGYVPRSFAAMDVQ